MADEKQPAANKPEATKARFKVPTGKGEGFDPETEKPLGVDPETDELVSVTPAGLAAYYGLKTKEADELYRKIAGINHGSVFFSPNNEPTDYQPPLNIVDLKKEFREKVDKVLSEVKAA